MWCITLIDLWILKNPCIPGIKPTWSWCMIFLMCCWILIAKILIKKPSWKTQTIDTPWREAPDNCLAGKSRRHQEPGWTQAGSHFRQNEDLETFPGFPSGSDGKESACSQEIQVQSLGQEDPLEKGMAAHSCILAWKTPWTEELGGLQFMGSQRVAQDWVTNTHTYTQKLSWGPVVKNLPAGDTESIPGLERFHMPWGSWACAPQLLRLSFRAHQPQRLSPCALEAVLHSKWSHHNEKPVCCNWRGAPAHHKEGKPTKPRKNKFIKNEDLREWFP